MTNDKPRAPLFEVRQLSKQYRVGGFWKSRHLHALRDVSFVLERSEIVALVGESGSGKSTVARVCVRLTDATNGQILLDGRNVLQDEPKRASLGYRKRVQMIFQDPFGSLNPTRTVAQDLERPLRLHAPTISANEMPLQIESLLDIVGLSPARDFIAKFPAELSGGQRQRIAFARALAVEPDIIFADEPVSMLDLSIRAGILNLMLELKEKRGVAFVYITHDLASARYVADRTMVLYAGQMVESGPSEAVFQEPHHPYTKLLLAAAPQIDVPLQENLPARSGAPDLINPGPGCSFANRCPNVRPICTTSSPMPIMVDDERIVRCHLFQPSSDKKPAAD